MANDVFANGREISCKKADGKSMCAFPDVCFTPPENPATPPGVPLPYPNTGFASDTTDGSKTVNISGKEVMLKNKSYFKKSIGDEAGCAAKKGFVTSTHRGKVYFIAWSDDVKIEGENAVRHLDMTTHNHASPIANEAAPMVYVDRMALMNQTDKCKTEKGRVERACGKKLEKAKCPDAAAIKAAKRKHRRAKSGSIARANAQADLDKAHQDYAVALQRNPCQKALACAMTPYKKGKKTCCPHQTPDHVIPASQFFGDSRGGRKRPGCRSYSDGGAPCICANGGKSVATHGMLGGYRKAYMDRNGFSGQTTWEFKDSVTCAIDSVNRVHKHCSKKCIEAQLRQGSHSKIKDDTKIGTDQENVNKAETERFRKSWKRKYG